MGKSHLRDATRWSDGTKTYCGRKVDVTFITQTFETATCKTCLAKDEGHRTPAPVFPQYEENELVWGNIYYHWRGLRHYTKNKLIPINEVVAGSPVLPEFAPYHGYDPYRGENAFWAARSGGYENTVCSNPGSLATTARALTKADTQEKEAAVLLSAWAGSTYGRDQYGHRPGEWPVNLYLFKDACLQGMLGLDITPPWEHTMTTLLPCRKFDLPKPQTLRDVVFLALADATACRAFFNLVKVVQPAKET